MSAEVDVQAVYGVRSRRPKVALVLTEGEHRAEVHLSPAEALGIARDLVMATASTLSDAAVVRLLGGESLTTDEVAKALTGLRAARGAIDAEEGLL